MLKRILIFILLSSCSLVQIQERSILTDDFWFKEKNRNNLLQENVLEISEINQRQNLIKFLDKWKLENGIDTTKSKTKKSLNKSILKEDEVLQLSVSQSPLFKKINKGNQACCSLTHNEPFYPKKLNKN